MVQVIGTGIQRYTVFDEDGTVLGEIRHGISTGWELTTPIWQWAHTLNELVRWFLVYLGRNQNDYVITRQGRQVGRASGSGRSRARRFGVEIELTGPEPSRIIQAIRAEGVAIRDGVSGYRATNRATAWELKRDGSVTGYGLELVSPPLRGEDGFAELAKVCRALNSVDATVDRSCGLHVHHDMNRRSAAEIKKFVAAYVERQDTIDRLVAPSRRPSTSAHARSYCAHWRDGDLAQLRLASFPGSNLRDIAFCGPRGNINLHAYARHGTVEIRQHGGTTQNSKISAWVRFGQALFKAANTDGVQLSATDPVQLVHQLESYGLTSDDARTLLRFENAAERLEELELSGAVS